MLGRSNRDQASTVRPATDLGLTIASTSILALSGQHDAARAIMAVAAVEEPMLIPLLNLMID
jgi:hypothetical protein